MEKVNLIELARNPFVATVFIFSLGLLVMAVWVGVKAGMYILLPRTHDGKESLRDLVAQTKANGTDLGIALNDAIRQICHNTLEYKYFSKIEGIANLLPPIGLAGTVSGLIVALTDMQNILHGLGIKLYCTLIGLAFYITVESLKFFLKHLASHRIEAAMETGS